MGRKRGRKKLSGKVVRALLAEKNWEPVEGWEYADAKTPIPGRCLICGHESTGPRLHDLKNKGKGACVPCSRVGGRGRSKLPEDKVRALLAEKNWEPVEGWEYADVNTPIPGQCLVCGYEGPGPRYSGIKRGEGACKECSARKRRPSEETVRALLVEKNWEPIEGWKYVKADTPIPGRCLVDGCGRVSAPGKGPRYSGLKKGGGACKKCSGKEKLSEETVRALLVEKNWEPTEPFKYEGIFTPIPGRCLACGYESGPDGGPRYASLQQGHGACRPCSPSGYDPSKPGYLYTFAFTDDLGVDFICYGITNRLGKRRYQYERHFAIRGFQALRFEDGAKAARAEKLFHDVRKASNAPYPNSQVSGTKTEAFPLSNLELCTVFNHHWIAMDAVSNNKFSLHAPNGELVKQA